MSVLSISQPILQKMISHAESIHEECCGFMLGIDATQRVVTEVIPARNSALTHRERQFEIHPLEFMRTEKYADEKQIQIVGIYHSHPDHPAVPSEHDRLYAQPHFSYLILSLDHQRYSNARSWKLSDQLDFIEEEINQ